MSTNFHFGDSVTQHGDHNVGIVKNYNAPTGDTSPIETLLAAVRALREQVSEEDREVLDQAVDAIGSGEEEPPAGAVRRALASIAGVAAMVGAIGVPVVEAVQAVKAALGI
ncbi:hypothetical protein [Streptomyces sp. NPDC047974]|uniref:hypothetical protein n=1 Tax=Streptomyces sp. NPDC047974 TaxID=3154343 RepID=UPI0033E37FAB